VETIDTVVAASPPLLPHPQPQPPSSTLPNAPLPLLNPLTSVETIDTVVAAMENCVNIRPSRLMPCSNTQRQQQQQQQQQQHMEDYGM